MHFECSSPKYPHAIYSQTYVPFLETKQGETSAKSASEKKCQRIQPCERIIYEPSMSNAALSEIAIDDILAGDNTCNGKMMDKVRYDITS